MSQRTDADARQALHREAMAAKKRRQAEAKRKVAELLARALRRQTTK